MPPADPDLQVEISDDPGNFEEAIRAFRQRIPLTDEEYDSLLEVEQEYAFTISNVAQADIVEFVYDKLDAAIAGGGSIEEFKADVLGKLEEAWGTPDGGRVDTIFRTNINKSFNAGKFEVYTSPAIKEARPYFRFEDIDDDREDEECAAAHDTILPQDDPFWNDFWPPIHPNCRCTVTALAEDEVDEGDLSDEAPDAEAADGFGRAPSEEGSDWEPSPSDYPDDLGNALADKLDE